MRISCRPSVRLVQCILGAVILLKAQVISAEEHIVRIVSDYETLRMQFEPRHLRIQRGDTVTWINEANEEHNVITYPDGFPKGAKPLQSQIMTAADERWSYQFEVTGTYEYHCIPHLPMGMRGTVIVDRASRIEEIHEPMPAEIEAYRDLLLKWFDEDDFEDLEHEDRASAIDFNVAAPS